MPTGGWPHRIWPGSSATAETTSEPSVIADVDSDPQLMRIQKALSDLGYGPLKADGVMGANTTAAIKRFELDRGLPLTGEPGSKTIENLERISGRGLSG